MMKLTFLSTSVPTKKSRWSTKSQRADKTMGYHYFANDETFPWFSAPGSRIELLDPRRCREALELLSEVRCTVHSDLLPVLTLPVPFVRHSAATASTFAASSGGMRRTSRTARYAPCCLVHVSRLIVSSFLSTVVFLFVCVTPCARACLPARRFSTTTTICTCARLLARAHIGESRLC